VKWLASLWRQTRELAASFGHQTRKIASLPAQWIEQRKRPKVQLYHYEHVEELPDLLQAHTLYLAGENGYFWAAAMLCPCGCGDAIELNLLKKARPCWTVHEHSDRSASLTPSVWRRQGCRSHFFLRHGRIDWCQEYAVQTKDEFGIR